MGGWRNGLAGMVGAALWCGAAGADDEGVVHSGRYLESNRDARIAVDVGAIIEMEGFVQETTRALYTVTGNTFKNEDAERYDLNDFDVDGGYAAIGLSFETAWKYVTLGGRVLAMNPTADSTAQRNYYIDVDDVTFNGVEYDNLKIPEGTPFSAEMTAFILEFQVLATPFSFWMNESARFTPWIGLGLFSVLGSYEIDVGPATGVVQYQNPPEDFVVGGHAEGDLAGLLPEIVAGGEFVFGAEHATHYLLQGTVGFLEYNGSSSLFVSSEHYDKDADISLLHIQARAAVEIPLDSGPVLWFAAQYEVIETDGTLKQSGVTDEEILARGERFDKEFDFYMSLATASVGISF